MIIAVDFDGVLCEDRFPEIGRPYEDAVRFVREMASEGHELILWTSRTEGRLDEALEWCGDRGIEFCAVNGNAPSNLARYSGEYSDPSPKVYADVYLEDHCPFFQFFAQGGRERAVGMMVSKARQFINRNGGRND